eukprot:jgi/Mesvir1/26309/Mv26043-RA.1
MAKFRPRLPVRPHRRRPTFVWGLIFFAFTGGVAMFSGVYPFLSILTSNTFRQSGSVPRGVPKLAGAMILGLHPQTPFTFFAPSDEAVQQMAAMLRESRGAASSANGGEGATSSTSDLQRLLSELVLFHVADEPVWSKDVPDTATWQQRGGGATGEDAAPGVAASTSPTPTTTLISLDGSELALSWNHPGEEPRDGDGGGEASTWGTGRRQLMVNGVVVQLADVAYLQGVIHVLDGILTPPHLQKLLARPPPPQGKAARRGSGGSASSSKSAAAKKRSAPEAGASRQAGGRAAGGSSQGPRPLSSTGSTSPGGGVRGSREFRQEEDAWSAVDDDEDDNAGSKSKGEDVVRQGAGEGGSGDEEGGKGAERDEGEIREKGEGHEEGEERDGEGAGEGSGRRKDGTGSPTAFRSMEGGGGGEEDKEDGDDGDNDKEERGEEGSRGGHEWDGAGDRRGEEGAEDEHGDTDDEDAAGAGGGEGGVGGHDDFLGQAGGGEEDERMGERKAGKGKSSREAGEGEWDAGMIVGDDDGDSDGEDEGSRGRGGDRERGSMGHGKGDVASGGAGADGSAQTSGSHGRPRRSKAEERERERMRREKRLQEQREAEARADAEEKSKALADLTQLLQKKEKERMGGLAGGAGQGVGEGKGGEDGKTGEEGAGEGEGAEEGADQGREERGRKHGSVVHNGIGQSSSDNGNDGGMDEQEDRPEEEEEEEEEEGGDGGGRMDDEDGEGGLGVRAALPSDTGGLGDGDDDQVGFREVSEDDLLADGVLMSDDDVVLPCGGHGVAEENGTCVCAVLFRGQDCQEPVRPPEGPKPPPGAPRPRRPLLPYVGTDGLVFSQKRLKREARALSLDKPVSLQVEASVDGPQVLVGGLSTRLYSLIWPWLAERDPLEGWAFRSCAVVGPAGALKRYGLGEEIDGHEAVIRFNDAPTRGYERHVGNKTTLRVNHWEFAGYKEGDEMVVVALFSRNGMDNLVRFKRKVEDGDFYFLTTEFLSHVVEAAGGVVPSTGFVGLSLALQLCARVDVYGMFLSERQGSRYHYYDKAIAWKAGLKDSEYAWAAHMAEMGLLTFAMPCFAECRQMLSKCSACAHMSIPDLMASQELTAEEVAQDAARKEEWDTLSRRWKAKDTSNEPHSKRARALRKGALAHKLAEEAQEENAVLEVGWEYLISSGGIDNLPERELRLYFERHGLEAPPTVIEMIQGIKLHHQQAMEGRGGLSPRPIASSEADVADN